MNLERRQLISFLAVGFVAVIAFTSVTLPVRSDDEHQAKVKQGAAQSAKAAKVFDAIMHAPNKSVPRDLLARAKAIAVFPQLIKASFVVGEFRALGSSPEFTKGELKCSVISMC